MFNSYPSSNECFLGSAPQRGNRGLGRTFLALSEWLYRLFATVLGESPMATANNVADKPKA